VWGDDGAGRWRVRTLFTLADVVAQFPTGGIDWCVALDAAELTHDALSIYRHVPICCFETTSCVSLVLRHMKNKANRINVLRAL
jgi:hypothetical protein